jgi:hypothetical protein
MKIDDNINFLTFKQKLKRAIIFYGFDFVMCQQTLIFCMKIRQVHSIFLCLHKIVEIKNIFRGLNLSKGRKITSVKSSNGTESI